MAERYLHLHIGRHKTGTTSFQAFLDKNQKTLLDQDIALFESEISLDPRGSNPLSWAHELPLMLLRTEFSFALRLITETQGLKSDNMRRTIHRNLSKQTRHLIASHEALSYVRSPEELFALKKFADESNRLVKVYLVLREPKSWLHSYSRQIDHISEKNPSSDSFAYLKPDSWIFDNEALVRAYETVFGLGAVRAFSYETMINNYNDTSTALFDSMELGVNSSELETVPWQNVTEKKLTQLKIGIVGPGRSGTSLLVKLFQAWGFSVPESGWHEAANAGGEMRLNPDSQWEVQKDPWAYQYIEKLDMSKFTHVIIPIRDLAEAASSRVAQELFSMVQHMPSSDWDRNAIGYTPGGVIADVTTSSVSNILSKGLWELLIKLAEQGVQPILLHFPRFAEDFSYVENHLGAIWESRISVENARAVWAELCSGKKIRASFGSVVMSNRERELLTLIEVMRSQLNKGSDDTDSKAIIEAIDGLLVDRKSWDEESEAIRQEFKELSFENSRVTERLLEDNHLLRHEIDALYSSKTWRWSQPIRKLLSRK